MQTWRRVAGRGAEPALPGGPRGTRQIDELKVGSAKTHVPVATPTSGPVATPTSGPLGLWACGHTRLFPLCVCVCGGAVRQAPGAASPQRLFAHEIHLFVVPA